MEKRIPRRRFKEFVGSGGWQEKKLGELVEYGKAGGTPTTTNNKYYDGGNIEFLSISDMTNQGKYIYKTEKKITKSGVENSTTWIVPKNSLIYSMYASIGFVSINKIELCTSQAMYSIILKDRYNLDYVYYYLYYFRNEKIKSLIETGTQGNLNAQLVKDINIPIPSLAEQEKIGHFFQKLDRLIDINREKLDKLKASKSAYLTEMFPGEGEDRPRRRFQGFTGPWQEKKLGEISDVRDGTHDSPKFISKGYPLVTSKNVKHGYINYYDIKYISKKDYESINKRSKVDKNDILMGMIGTIGNVALIRKTPNFAIKNVALIKNINRVNYLYLYYNIQCSAIKLQLFEGIDGGTQKFISLNKIRKLKIFTPSLAEQEKIGNFFKKLDQQIEVQEEKLEKLEKMKKAYLAEMFV